MKDSKSGDTGTMEVPDWVTSGLTLAEWIREKLAATEPQKESAPVKPQKMSYRRRKRFCRAAQAEYHRAFKGG